LPLQLEDETESGAETRILLFDQARQSFTFTGLTGCPIPSLLRDFSAPVKVDYAYTPAQLSVLIAHDPDPFARWEAAQRLSQDCILEQVSRNAAGMDFELSEELVSAVHGLLQDQAADPALLAEAMKLPDEEYLGEQMEAVDVDGIHAARQFVRRGLANRLTDAFRYRYDAASDEAPYSKSPDAIARRSLRNVCLSYLAETGSGGALCRLQLSGSDNMTDSLAALGSLVRTADPAAEEALAAFERRWKDDALVMDKWFAMQATQPGHETVRRVRKLMRHPAFSMRNPNKVRSLVGAFAMLNPTGFHAPDGAGYEFLAERVIELNETNPQVAARMVSAFNRWKRYDADRQSLMRRALEGIAARPALSPDVAEIVNNALK
jgi:aminopeptidase N